MFNFTNLVCKNNLNCPFFSVNYGCTASLFEREMNKCEIIGESLSFLQDVSIDQHFRDLFEEGLFISNDMETLEIMVNSKQDFMFKDFKNASDIKDLNNQIFDVEELINDLDSELSLIESEEYQDIHDNTNDKIDILYKTLNSLNRNKSFFINILKSELD